MSMLRTALLTAALLAMAGCSSSAPEESAGGNDTKDETVVAAAVPTGLFADTPPIEVINLIDAKTEARAGDRVTFAARVGGRRAPFVNDRAVFFVCDPSRKDCNELHDDACKTPWDYCCEPRDSLLRHMATVQVVDAEGKLLEGSLEDLNGLAPSKTVYVSGVVDQVDESGTFVVNAEMIFVEES